MLLKPARHVNKWLPSLPGIPLLSSFFFFHRTKYKATPTPTADKHIANAMVTLNHVTRLFLRSACWLPVGFCVTCTFKVLSTWSRLAEERVLVLSFVVAVMNVVMLVAEFVFVRFVNNEAVVVCGETVWLFSCPLSCSVPLLYGVCDLVGLERIINKRIIVRTLDRSIVVD